MLTREMFRRLSFEPQPDWWRKVALPSLLIAILFALSVLAGLKPSLLLLLPLALPAGLLVMTRASGAVLPLLLLSSLVVPFSVGTGTETRINPPMLLLGGLGLFWLLETLVHRDENRILGSRAALVLISLLVVSALSLIVGQLPWFRFVGRPSLPVQLGGLSLFAFSVLAFIWVGDQIKDLRWLKRATWLFVAIGALYVVTRAVPQLPTLQLSPGAEGSVFWIFLASLTFSQAAFNKALRLPLRIGLAVVVGTMFYVAYVQTSSWKSGWVPPVFSILAIVVMRWPRFGLVLAVISILPALDIVNSLIEADQYSFSTRIEAWQILLQIIKVNPVLGLGPANYSHYTPLFPIRGYAVNFNSHNQYVDLIAQTGILGLFCYLWFFWEVGKLGWRLRDRLENRFANAYVYASLGALVGMLVAGMLGDWIIPFVYNVGFKGFRASVLGWLFLGGLVTLHYIDSSGAQIDREFSSSH